MSADVPVRWNRRSLLLHVVWWLTFGLLAAKVTRWVGGEGPWPWLWLVVAAVGAAWTWDATRPSFAEEAFPRSWRPRRAARQAGDATP